MILRTSIYNNNYYPIKLYNLKNTIFQDDATSVHDKFHIQDTSFNNELGITIKPFQDVEYFTVIEPNDDVLQYNGNIKFDQVFTTDSADYGKFGNISTQQYNLNKQAIQIKFDNESRVISSEDSYKMDENSFIDIEFNMKGISDQDKVFQYLKQFNLHNFEIDDVQFYGDGIYSTYRLTQPIPDECGMYTDYRGDQPVEHFSNTNLITAMDAVNGQYRVWIDKVEQDAQVKFKCPGKVLTQQGTALTTEYDNLMKGFMEDKNDAPVEFVLPIGMSVVLNLTPKHRNPYKLNLKIYTNITILPDIASLSQEVTQEMPVDIKDFLKYTFEESSNRNTLVVSPGTINVYSHPSDFYTAQTMLYMYPFKNHQLEGSFQENEMTINSITQKNASDAQVINGNVTIAHDTLPSKKIIPQDEKYLDRNPFNIFIDTTGISEEYHNSIIVNFTNNDKVSNREIPVSIYPNIKLESKCEIKNIYLTDSDKIPCASCVPGNKNKFPYLNTFVGHVGQPDLITIELINTGNTNAKIKSVELIDVNNLDQFSEHDDYDLLKDNIVYGNNADALKYEYTILPEDQRESDQKYDVTDLVDQGKLSDYISYSIKNIKNEDMNMNTLKPLIIQLQINRLNETQNQIFGKCAIIKIELEDGKVLLSKTLKNSLRFLNTQVALTYEKSQELTYIKPRIKHTLFTKFFKSVNNTVLDSFGYGSDVVITSAKLINYDDNAETNLLEDEIFIDKSVFPFTILDKNSNTKFNFDIELKQEKLYQFKIRFYTNIPTIKFIDVPYEIICTDLDPESAIKFDEDDFYVENNKYFLSLNRMVPKKRKISIKNTSNIDLIINGIDFELPSSDIHISNVDNEILTPIELPYKLTKKNPIKLDFEFIGKEYGRNTGFISLDTNLGIVYLPVVIFVNTKIKDVMVLMQNKRGVEFKSPINSVDKEFIKLINFGDDPSLIDITKLGYDKNEFLVQNNSILYGNNINYIESMFMPTTTGKKNAYLDIKIKDMLETFILRNNDQSKEYKIQNTHIIAQLTGNAVSDDALPQFSKSIVDFGYISRSQANRRMRYDTFEIKNLGLTPFVITNISKTNQNSPFLIPLGGQKLPIKVDNQITLPIWLNNKAITDDQSTYTDIIKFEMQDLKSKKLFTYDVILKIEISETKKEHFSFNSDTVDFGFCPINHFKTDEITVKNFSNEKVSLKIDTTGMNEIQSLNNMVINLQPSQAFDIPIYFYPHGLSKFTGDIVLNFNSGKFIKKINVSGMGVDVSQPKIKIENQMDTYLKYVLDNLAKPKDL